MAYLIPKETIKQWIGDSRQPPGELPDYFVFSACGQHRWRCEPLSTWLNRQDVHKRRRHTHRISPVLAENTGYEVRRHVT